MQPTPHYHYYYSHYYLFIFIIIIIILRAARATRSIQRMPEGPIFWRLSIRCSVLRMAIQWRLGCFWTPLGLRASAPWPIRVATSHPSRLGPSESPCPIRVAMAHQGRLACGAKAGCGRGAGGLAGGRGVRGACGGRHAARAGKGAGNSVRVARAGQARADIPGEDRLSSTWAGAAGPGLVPGLSKHLPSSGPAVAKTGRRSAKTVRGGDPSRALARTHAFGSADSSS